ncbi:MAG: redoxin domain-containing protein [Cytophagales bacterium]|nr:redoxin domain-containing protein [Cytophaga sp.]
MMWALLGSFSSVFAATKPQTGYEIKVQIKGLKASDTVFLARYYADKRYYQDTAVVDVKGNIVFADTTHLKEGMYFLLLPGQKIVDFILNPTVFSFSLDTANCILSAQFKNSPDNTAFYDYQKFFVKQRTKADSLNALYKSGNEVEKAAAGKQLSSIDSSMLAYIQNFLKVHPKNLFASVLKVTKEVDVPPAPKNANGSIDSLWQYRYYKQHYFDNVDFTDDRLIRTPVLIPKVDTYFKNLVVQRPDSINKEIDMILNRCNSAKDIFEYYVREYTYKYETSQVMGMDAVFVHLGKEYYMKGRCFWATPETVKKIQDRVEILDPLLLGKKAPPLYYTDTTGKYLYLYDVKAKYTILYFWDSQCGHCQKETPKLYEWWEKNRSKGIQVYAASIERKDEEWMKFIRAKGITKWLNMRDSKNHTDYKITYDVYSTPVMYILDQNKVIIAKRIGVENLDDFFLNYEKSLKTK